MFSSLMVVSNERTLMARQSLTYNRYVIFIVLQDWSITGVLLE